jgi:hypothetical protein
MPLSTPAGRTPLHTRLVDCRGYRRDDGLWDIEGRVTDAKAYDFENESRGRVSAGDYVHDLSIRLTVDEDLVIHDVEAASDAFPFPACPAITPAVRKLIGLSVAPGWMRDVRRELGGTRGCTHLIELLGPVATTAYQTVFPTREKREAADANRAKPGHLDTCHALASDGEAVRKHWPDFYTGA